MSQGRCLGFKVKHESLQRFFSSLNLNLDILGGITDPPFEIMSSCQLINKGSKANPLDYAANTDVQ